MGALDVQITGAATYREVAAQIRAEGAKGLGREMTRALEKAAKPIQASVRSEYKGLPGGGGYAGLFSRSLRFRLSSRTNARTATLRVLTFADGTHERRDIGALEDGRLRHPVFGRSRAGRGGRRISNPWATTSVRGGFHKRGTDDAIDDAARQIGTVLDDFAQRLIK